MSVNVFYSQSQMMMEPGYLVLMLIMVSRVRAGCGENATSVASVRFKECMDQSQAAVLQLNNDLSTGDLSTGDVSALCHGLEQFSSGCEEVIERFSQCKSVQYVNNLVNIHIESMAGTEQYLLLIHLKTNKIKNMNKIHKSTMFQSCWHS